MLRKRIRGLNISQQKYWILDIHTPIFNIFFFLSDTQSGCCKPPTSCGYTYVNETVWNPAPGVPATDPDCTRWSNDQQVLCYQCDSCKAGVLATTRRHWRKVSVINIVVLVLLVILYLIGCIAYRHAKRAHYDETYGVNRMSKTAPSMFRFQSEVRLVY